jgi:hypothetical protein
MLTRQAKDEILAIQKDAAYNLHQTTHRVWGFLADPTKSAWENAKLRLGAMSPRACHARPANMAFHNLCATMQVPPGTAALLGLGLKRCIEQPRPCQDFNRSMHRFRRDMRLHCAVQGFNADITEEDSSNKDHIQCLCIPSNWKPPEAPLKHELTFDAFDEGLTAERHLLTCTRLHNLAPSQRHVLSELSSRTDLIVPPTDKNLGPCVIERKVCIAQAFKEHLQTSNYEPTSQEAAPIELQKQKDAFLAMCSEHKHALPTTAEQTYFKRAITEECLNATRVPQFHGTFKVHKIDKKMRPVISCVNSTPEIFSKWVDHHLKTVVGSFLPTHMKDSIELQQSLMDAFPNGLPPNAKSFSVDAVGMHANIDTSHGLQVISDWLSLYKDDLPADFPSDMVNASLKLIMTDNILQFGDTFWRQLRGTAMGTSTAVNYANLYVGLLEVTTLLKKFRKELLFYRRFIDDGIGVWLSEDPLAWSSFLDCLNSWGSLKWTSDDLTDEIIFMDLTIQIDPLSNRNF